MNAISLGYFPLFHGYTLLVVYIAALIVLPFAGFFCSLRDYRGETSKLKPPDAITSVRAWFILFRLNEFVLMWCFLAGVGLLLFGSAVVFFAQMISGRVCAVVMILTGVFLGLYAERNCGYFR